MKPFSIVITTLCFLIWLAPVGAQVSVGTFSNWSVQTGLTNTMAATVKSAGRSGRRGKGPVPTVTFKPDPKTSRRTQLALIGIVGKQDGAAAAEMEKIFQNNDVVAMFDRDMRPYGLSSKNVPDTMAAFIVANWMIANQADLPKPAHVKAVRDNISWGMSKALGRLKPNQQQMIAEMMVYQTMFAIGARTSAQGNPAKMKNLSNQARQTLMSMGVDALQYELTSKGMVPK